MQKPLIIILLAMCVGAILAVGLYVATYLGITPFGIAINNFFTMVGVIIFLISGFFLLSLETLQRK